MGEFRIGRRFAQHSYPESRQNTTVPFARNFAQGPADLTPITMAGIQVPWDVIESGAPPGADVPIVPQATGRVRLIASLTIGNTGEGSETAVVRAQTNGMLIDFPQSGMTIPGGGVGTIPYVLDIGPGSVSHPIPLAVGSPTDIELFVTATSDGVLSLAPNSSTLDIQELPVS
jgi:hypothetical protein